MDHAAQRHHRTITDLLAAVTRAEGHRPLLTCYDDTTGSRTELSYATLDNWSAKTANLLVEEYYVSTGQTVLLDLDGHWATAVLTLACWRLGAVPRLRDHAAVPPTDRGGASSAPADHGGVAVVCCHEQRVDRYPDGPLLVVGDGLATEPLGDVGPRPGLMLLGEQVHGFADDHDGDVTPSTQALPAMDHAALLSCAAAWHDVLGDRPRVGLATALDDPRAIDLLAGIMLARGGLVADHPPADPPRWQRWSSERVSVVVGNAGTLGSAPAGVDVVGFDAVALPA